MADSERHPRVISPNPRLSRDEIANQPFPQAFRGLSEPAVRAFLRKLADEFDALRTRQAELQDEIAQLQDQLEHAPVVEGVERQASDDDLLSAVGDETARVLRSAKESAEEIRRNAEERAAETLHEAHEEARALREQAEQSASDRTREADEASAEILREAEKLARELQEGAEARAAEFVTQSETEARAELESARRRSAELVAEGQAARDRLLNELHRRRDALEGQIEGLRSGRDRLLEAYKVVKQTFDEATEALRSADAPTVAPSPPPERPRVTSPALPVQPPSYDEPEPEPKPAPTPTVEAEAAEAEGAEGDAAEEEAETPKGPPKVAAFSLGELPHAPEAPGARESDAGVGADMPATEPAWESDSETAARGEASGAETSGDSDDLESGTAADSSASDAGGQAPEGSTEEDVTGGDAQEPEADGDVSDSREPEEEDPAGGAEDREQAEKPGPRDVDAIFAKLKAEKGEEADESEHDESEPAEPEEASAAEISDADEAPVTPTAPDIDLLRRRDETVDTLVDETVKQVKRVVRDEQNVVLEAIREHKKGVPSADDVLPSVADQDQAFAEAVGESLAGACAAGEDVARSLGVAGPANGSGAGRRQRTGELAAVMARQLMDPLRGKLGDALREAAGVDGSDVAERIRSRYREWKGQRIETNVRDVLTAAFARGLFDAVPEGVLLRWVPGDAAPCPDCADNALEHTTRGKKFPTGHLLPPAHPGCRCLVLPEEVPAESVPAGAN